MKKLGAFASNLVVLGEIGAQNVAVPTQLRPLNNRSMPSRENIVSIHSEKYSPSRDLLKSMQPGNPVRIASNLHSKDLALQRTVLSLAMPNTPDLSLVKSGGVYNSTLAHADVIERGKMSEGSDSPGIDAFTQMENFGSALTDQLTTMANLIVQRVCISRQSDLDAIEVAQINEMRSLANLVIQCMRNELQEVIQHIQSPSSQTPAPLNVEDIAKRISQQVASSLEKYLHHRPPQSEAVFVNSMTEKLSSYFLHLETTLKSALAQFNLSQPIEQSSKEYTTTGAHFSDEVRDSILNTIQQSSRLQQENLLNALEDNFNLYFSKLEDKESRKTGPGEMDNRALEAFIESSLQTATDDIRHAIAAEVKKAIGRKSEQSNPSQDNTSTRREEMEGLLMAIDKAVLAAQQTFSYVESINGTIQGMSASQANTTQIILDLKKLLQTELDAQHELAQNTEPSAVAHFHEVLPLIEDLKKSVAQLDASIEVRQEHTESQLLNLAHVIGESVQAAVEARTASALASAVSTLETYLEKLSEVVRSGQSKDELSPSTPDAADIAAAVESLLAPKMEMLLAQLEGAMKVRRVPDDMADLANSISDSVITVVREEYRRREEQAAEASSLSQDRAAFSERLAQLRSDLIATVEREMGKTHNVNLTPMYQYIDSMLVFLKNSFATQETNLEQKVEELLKKLSDMMTSTLVAQKEQQGEISQQQPALTVLDFKPEAIKALSQVVKQETAHSQSTLALLEKRVDQLATGEDLKKVLGQFQTSLTMTIEPVTAYLSSPKADYTTTTKAITALQHQLIAVEDSISRFGVHYEESLTSKLKTLLETVDMTSLKERLSTIELVLGEQASTLEALRQSADRAFNVNLTSPGSGSEDGMSEPVAFQVQVDRRLENIQKLLARLDDIPGQEVHKVVKQIQRDMSEVREWSRKGPPQLLQDATASTVVGASEEASEDTTKDDDVRSIVKEAVSEVVKAELLTFAQTFQEGFQNLSASEKSIKQDLLIAIENVTKLLEAQEKQRSGGTPVLTKENAESLIASQGENIKGLLERQAKKMLDEMSESMGTVADSTSAQVSNVLRDIQGVSQKDWHDSMDKGMQRQTQELRSVFVREMDRLVTETKAIVTDAIEVQAAAREKLELIERKSSLMQRDSELSQKLVDQNTAVSAQTDTKSLLHPRAPLWWFFLTTFSPCLVIFMCMYYVFVGFLLAFVPKPDQYVLDSHMNVPEPFNLHDIRTQQVRRGRRVVDQVL